MGGPLDWGLAIRRLEEKMSARPDEINAIRSAPTYRLSRSRERGGSLAVTVPASQLLLVRRAIVQSGCEHVGIMTASLLACGTRVRLIIAVPPQEVARLQECIRWALDS
jgi:hypothetical protein